jgi:hypothetical protein
MERGDARLLDLRTEVERRRYGAPPGAVPASLARHVLKPEGEGTIYLCQHAVRSKATRATEPARSQEVSPHGGRPACQSRTYRDPTTYVSSFGNKLWSLYGAPWLQPVAIGRKSLSRGNGSNS